MFDFASPMRGEPVDVVLRASARRGVSARTVLRRLWKGSGFIVLGGLFMLATAVAVLSMLTPTYTSTVQILIDPSDLRGLDNEVTARIPQADSGTSLAESQTRVIQSDNVLRRVVDKLALEDDPEFVKADSTNPVTVFIKTALGMEPPPASRDAAITALDTLRNKLTVRRPERTFVIDVSVVSKDPRKAADIANAVADAYFTEEASARTDAARRVSDSLAGRLSELRKSVEVAEGKVVKYRADNRLSTASGRLLNDQQLGDLNQQLVTASIRTAEARSRLDQAKAMRAAEASTALPEMLQSLEMQALRQQYATLSRNTAELATRLGARHPAMAEQMAQQRDMERLIQNEKQRIIETSQKDYDRAAASEAAIRKNLATAQRDLAANDRATVGLRELEREVEARRGIYEAFLKRSRETGEQERINNTNVRVISSATPARIRSWPPSPKVVLPLALLLGCLFGAGIAYFLGASRDHRRSQSRALVPQKPQRVRAQPARSLRAADV